MQPYDPSTVADLFAGHRWESPGLCGPNGGNCVEVNLGVHGVVGLRDSKLAGGGPVLVFADDEWNAFLEAARAGQFDR